MRKIIFPIALLFSSADVLAQTVPSASENYIYTKSYISSATDPFPKPPAETIQYFDGLGRAKQVVSVKASPSQKDVVTHVEYDGFGRQPREYLPVPQSGTSNGAIYASPLANASSTPYGSERIYSEKVLENSPLDRVLSQTQVGSAWSSKPVSFGYEANADGEVKRYEATFNYTTFTSALSIASTSSYVDSNGFYKNSLLYKNTVTDEDGNVSIEFKRGDGKTLLTRKLVGGTQYADTYYVYNDYDQLAFVIPPLASSGFKALSPGTVITTTNATDVNNLCYQYRYDGRSRLVEKKLPGKGWEYMLYDLQDRLVATQDANLGSAKLWLFTKYDQFGRAAYTGMYTSAQAYGSAGRSAEQANVEAKGANNESAGGTTTLSGLTFYYANTAFPTSITKLLSVSYYDSYPSDTAASLSAISTTVPTAIQGQALLKGTAVNGLSTKGLPTASYVKNIDDDKWTKTYTWYDQKARPVGTYAVNYLGGYTKSETLLDFGGVAQKVDTYHRRVAADAEVQVKERFVYDAQNRLKQHFHQVGTKPEELLAENSYNELGQLVQKKVGQAYVSANTYSAPIQTVDYGYNIRGWLTNINDPASLGADLFGYRIRYSETPQEPNPSPSNPLDVVTARYNGNIAEVDWSTATDNVLRRYGYIYDGLNRLSSAYYQDYTKPRKDEYGEKLAYDLNGNITSLKRTAAFNITAADVIDDLSYTYTGNRLISVRDASANYVGYPDTSGSAIAYDANGNMASHNDRGIISISYNYLNLPKMASFNVTYIPRNTSRPVNVRTGYSYRADGVKVKKSYNHQLPKGQAGEYTENTDYLDGFQYVSSTTVDGMGATTSSTPPSLQFFPTAEGYYDYAKNAYIYQYKDHLGNVRLAYTKNTAGTGAIALEESNYYPFGLKHEGYNYIGGENTYYTYSFQGQERQEDTGWLSFKWRNYDPAMARFFNVDPLAAKYPYNTPYSIQENKLGLGRELEGLELVPRGTEIFEHTVTQTPFGATTSVTTVAANVPASQKDIHGEPVFDAGSIGLTTTGYDPNQAAISTGKGLIVQGYEGEAPEDAQMSDAPAPSNVETPEYGGATLLDGVKTLFGLAVQAKDIITGKTQAEVSNYVNSVKDIAQVTNQAREMGKAGAYVNKAIPNADLKFKADVTNYVFSGKLPTTSLMQNSGVITTGNAIMKANNIPIQGQPKQSAPKTKSPAPTPIPKQNL